MLCGPGVPTLEVRSSLACRGGLRGKRWQGQITGNMRFLAYWGLRRTAFTDPGPHHHFQQSSKRAGSAHLLYCTCPALTILNFLSLRAAILPFPPLEQPSPRALLAPFFSFPVTVAVQLLSHVRFVRDPTGCSPPGSSVHGILQARILEWVAISFSRGSSQPRD